MRRKHKWLLMIAAVLVTVGGIVAYIVADRYLIEHVDQPVSASTAVNAGADAVEAVVKETAAPGDDWNYSSSTKTISIKKVVTGTGADTVTYYVADVLLKNAADLISAFAKNLYGRNIVQYTSEIATNNGAIFAINGDYYGFRDDGVIIRNGILYRDTPTRTSLAIYNNGDMKIFDETAVSSAELLKSGVINTLSFGPVLVADSVPVADFTGIEIDNNFGLRTIQGLNPRTGLGVIAPDHYIFIVVDGRSNGYSKGMTLEDFARLFADLGCTQAYNLDGGGSTTMYFKGRVVNDPLGKGQERGTSDIIYIK